ncbi:uncharacterized protein [Clytia hemisphaerica]|uniref:Hemicentin-1 n=1 Tax=Clytia hemisphaerica TaxID=252671 RepID=A0A7M5VBM4_9CNID
MNFIISFSIFFILLHPSKSQDAIVNGTWAPWGDWGGCDKPCGTGFRYRWRKCTNPAPQNGGLDCAGDNREHKTCNTNLCERELGGTWRTTKLCKREQGYCLGPNGRKPSRRGVRELSSEMRGWKIWERKNCMQKCLQTRGITACEMPFGSYRTHDYSRYWTNKGCYGHTAPVTRGNGYEKTYCWVLSKCKTDGVWSQWSSWTGCPVCGPSGQRNRTRTCTDPEPLYGGSDCPKTDKHTEIENCEKKPPCPIHGKWSKWGFWGKCSRSCGTGRKTRTRTCTNPAPQHGGLDCTDSDTAVQNCNTKPCSVHGNWADWSSWGKCSASCGTSQQTRTRTCTNPAPQHGGLDCTGSGTAIRNCNTKPCPVDGKWSKWSAWGKCSASCGTSQQTITRTCTNPAPQHGGLDCIGSGTAIRNCNTKPCPIDGKWSKWGSWGKCSASCSTGQQTRTRTCTNPVPQYGGLDCTDIDSKNEIRRCTSHLCPSEPIDGKWSDWSSWGKCSASCGTGQQTRTRTCTNPEPQHGGLNCADSDSVVRNCNAKPCLDLTTDKNEIAEKVCKMKCIDMKRNCGQMLGCGDRRFDVSKHCPETCASTTHRTTDENEVAEKFCKMKCIDMKRNCGQMLGCGDQRFDVSKHCPETCASTTHRTTDENEVAEKFCKMKCIDMKRNCGQMLGCGDQRFDVSKHCPETCASTTHLTTDENEIAEKVCKMKCIDMKRNCGQVLGCGDRRFDVSKHCPKTCASTTRFIVVCEPKKEVMVMCYGRSYTLHGKAKNGASAKQYEWYKKSKKDSLVQLDSDSQYSITYSDRDPTKSSLTIRSFSMVKHEGFYAFRKANLNYIDCYDYKVTAFLQLEYNDGKDKFDVLAGEDLTLAVKAKDPASKTSWTVNGQSLIEPLIKASPHYNLPSTDDFGPTAQILEILNPQRRHGGIYKLKWSTRFHQCPIANIYFNVTVRERDTTSTTTSPTTITTTSVITTTPPSLPSTDKPVLKVGQKYVSQDENDDSIGFVMLIVGTFLIGLAIESVLWYFYKRELARKIRRSLSISLLHKDKNYKSESINQDELATDEENSDSQPLLHNGNVTPNSLQPIPSYRYGEGTLQ